MWHLAYDDRPVDVHTYVVREYDHYKSTYLRNSSYYDRHLMATYFIHYANLCTIAVCKSTHVTFFTLFLVLYKYRSQVFVLYSVTSFSFRQVE